MKLKKLIYTATLGLTFVSLTTSCEDMLDKGNDYVIYSDDNILNNPADTVTSVLGILNKLQGIAVRTNLLGEVRADLVTVNTNATTDLKDLADFNANVKSDDDANAYNSPREYYAVINNCNYFLAKADSTAGNTNRNEKYFQYEIAQVHSIRAWAYLQLVLAYGKVPFVTEPVVTKIQSDATYPMYDIDQVCDYFINDLKPYYGKQYPDYVNIGGDIDPQMCFYPTQVVMGDLYLWRAAIAGQDGGKAYAKQAAKSYYDYIIWNKNGKASLVTTSSRDYWSSQNLYNGMYKNPNGGLSYRTTGTWGGKTETCITAIPMDSAAADGYYNELRNLYNTTNNSTGYKEASISPSDVLKSLSRAQSYYGRDTYGNTVQVTEDKFTDEEINKGYSGDLRYQDNYSQRDTKYNNKEVKQQSISKHSSQHIGVYRAHQVYLRLAEALNYAGYPRFARQILTMGLSNIVIENEVSPYYTANGDSAFIAYFNFNDADFISYAQSYSEAKDQYGKVAKRTPSLRATDTDVNMWGIHGRGSGLPFLNPDYCLLSTPDSTSFPYSTYAAIGKKPEQSDYNYPVAPSSVKEPASYAQYGSKVLTEEEYLAAFKWATANRYSKYIDNDSVGKYVQYLEDMKVYQIAYDEADAKYQADMESYNSHVSAFDSEYDDWYASAYSNSNLIKSEQLTVDQAILDEQALELSYEGNRYYDLMRRAYWYNDNSKLVTPISKRTSAAGKLNTRSNWFLNYKDKIGM